MVEIQVENIVVAFSVSSCLDLPKLAEILPDAQYSPGDVPAVVLQFSHPRSMAFLTSSGQVVVTGPKTMQQVDDIVQMVLDRLSVVGIEPQEPSEVTVRNVSASTDLREKITLRTLAKTLQIPDYTPRVFPGLVYKVDDPNTVILLFDSGKIVCNGKSVEDVTLALEKMLEKLVSFGLKKEEKVCQK